MADKKNTATKLVEIAEELFTFGCATTPTSYHHRGEPEPVAHTYASPKNNPDVKRPLPDIRSDLAEVYQATYGSVPNATALGDAMTVLEGRARKATPVQVDEQTLAALLGGGTNSIATKLVELAQERFTFGVTTTGEVYAVPVDGPNVARVLRGARRSLRAELARIFYETTKTAANAQALADALLVLEGEAQGIEPTEVALRVGRSPVDGRLVLDLGTDDGRAVVIGAFGWEITDVSPVLFWRTNATMPLPIPDDLGSPGIVDETSALHAGHYDAWATLRALVDTWTACFELLSVAQRAGWVDGPSHARDRDGAVVFQRYLRPLALPAGYWKGPGELRLAKAAASNAAPGMYPWQDACERWQRIDRRQRNYGRMQVVQTHDAMGNVVAEAKSPERPFEFAPQAG
jgi:hypothetical protein